MQPIARRDTALLGVLPAQDLLAHQRHHDGVIHVVVGGITVGDVLQGETAHKRNDVRISRLENAIALGVRRAKLRDEGLDHNLCGIEHGRPPTWRMLFQFEPPVTGYGAVTWRSVAANGRHAKSWKCIENRVPTSAAKGLLTVRALSLAMTSAAAPAWVSSSHSSVAGLPIPERAARMSQRRRSAPGSPSLAPPYWRSVPGLL